MTEGTAGTAGTEGTAGAAGSGRGGAARALALAVLGVLASVRLATGQCPDGTPPPCGRPAAPRPPVPNSIAVLYFENLSRDTSDAYLADGLTEEIILRLQQVRRLQVRSRYESQRVRGQQGVTPAALGRALAARYLVGGTIQREGERLVVRVELTRADQGVGVWSARFDKTGASVLDVIDEAARGVATGVAGELLPAEAADLARRPTADPVAYQHLVRGNFYLAQRSNEALARAAEEYEAAFARDAALKVASSRVAYAYALGLAYGVGDLPPDSVQERGARAVERALRGAPDEADTWMALGFRQFMRTVLGAGDFFDESVAELARAAQLGPGNAEAHHQYAHDLVIAGRDSAALGEYRRALALEPGRAVTYQEIGFLLMLEGRYRETIAWCDSALAADSLHVRGYLVRGRARLLLGDAAGAGRDAASAAALARGGDTALVHTLRAMLLAGGGDTAGARREAASSGQSPYFGPEWMVVIGDADRALETIEGYASPALRCFHLRLPAVAGLRGRPRFDRMAAACPAPQRAP